MADQEPGMCVQVVEEGDRDDAPDGDTLVHGQDQERQPGHQGDADHAAHHEVQRGSRRVQAAPELVEGPPRTREKSSFRFREGCAGAQCGHVSARGSERRSRSGHPRLLHFHDPGHLAELEELLGRAGREQMHATGDDPGPSGLVARAEAGSVVAVEVLVEQEVVAPVRDPPETSAFPHRPAAAHARPRRKMLASRRVISSATWYRFIWRPEPVGTFDR